ncbi:flagellar biosynthesis repressor FlbT [Pseudogemmobacter faecipullorum]|uniref:Flagellar biosynthesis repressor FlbT n=1 Tax=Pseudogemmobacter faecipullorum TaxID=2755041 RepID=A0ABS8CJL6_9RHOB|nr:flagellar biosynthesis repressor FlbT [Pseudogemmobacter faecipullorum]MCB5409579.1 flagellar biosynthesis repressor FlbT [Pseudogemmobacter faecipullorum]
MSGLVLKLGPHERLLINGVVIENGDKRTRLAVLTPNASILRLRDALHPDEATTPVRRLCYLAQLPLSGDADDPEIRKKILQGIEQLSQVFNDRDSRHLLREASDSLLKAQYYQTLKALRALLPRESRLLSADWS